MASLNGLDQLLRWRTEDAASEEALGQLIAHPRFPAAIRTLFRGKVDTADQDKVMAGLFRDAGHYLAALWAFSLHRAGDLTLPRLKETCVASKLMSPGRTRALLLQLIHAGYLAQISPDRGRIPARYAPTTRFVDAWARHMRYGLEAASLIEPAARLVLDRMKDSGVASTFARHQGETILQTLSTSSLHDTPFVRIFVQRFGGGQIFAHLMSLGRENEAVPSAPTPFSIADLARRVEVSRVHVKRLLDDAEREGVVRIGPEGLTWGDGAKGFITFYCAFEFACLLGSAAATVDSHPDLFALPGSEAAWTPIGAIL